MMLMPSLNSQNESLMALWYYSLGTLLDWIPSEVFGALISFLGFDISIMSPSYNTF